MHVTRLVPGNRGNWLYHVTASSAGVFKILTIDEMKTKILESQHPLGISNIFAKKTWLLKTEKRQVASHHI